jgi:hypothetical protein
MKDHKNIERLFQEKFKDFEAIPPQESWNIIASRLNEKKKKKRIIPIWFQLSGIAASFIIIGALIWNFQSNQNTNSPNNSNETVVVGVDNSNSKDKKSNTDFNNNETLRPEKNIENSENNTIKFDSKRIDFEKSNPIVISNEKSNIRYKDKKNNSFESKNTLDTKNKKRYPNYNNKESNHEIVANSKAKRNKSSKKNLFLETDLIATTKKNKNSKLNPNHNTTTSKKGLINSDKINSFFDKTETNTNYVNTSNDSLANQTKDTITAVLALSENIITNDSMLVAEISPEINPLEELLKEKEAGKNEVEKEKEKRNRWAVSTNASPVYFNSISEGSSLDSQFSKNSKEFETTMSYGIGAVYQISNKFSFKTGVNALTFNYNTDNVLFNTRLNSVTNNIKTLDRNSNSENLAFSAINSKSDLGDALILLTESKGSIKQELSYVEVPLELSYKILDKKFGIDLIGGVSTLFLNANSISLISDGMEMNIGKANNLNDIHFSSNVGLGFKYNFWKSFNANFQPMFKYQINTFSENSGNFKPYFIGLYTGVSFSF